ncbi:hypothetical protein C5167_024990 [Papaver somniferum]|uniref:Uncharacterized protein n=1 Tax=Papaver somniferum TaxID=3469 RepID=A0A4Y7JQ78_PAPSO|nr:hypothetical protein C5167_024990 [Papaver somniferum]
MDTRDPRRTLRGHAKETKRKKSALQIDLNDTPPAEIKAAAALVECIQQGGGRSGILLQPLAPPPLTIDLEAIDDEVVISSPRSFAEARRNKARRNLEILITAERPATPPPPRDRVLMLPLTPVSMRLASRHVSASALLQKKLDNAKASIEVLIADLQFLRDQVTITQNWDVYQRRIKQVTATVVRDSRSFLSLNLYIVTLVRGLLSCVNGRNYIWEFRGPKLRFNKISVLSIIIGLPSRGVKAKPLKQPKAQHKEDDETDLENLQKKKRETLC